MCINRSLYCHIGICIVFGLGLLFSSCNNSVQASIIEISMDYPVSVVDMPDIPEGCSRVYQQALAGTGPLVDPLASDADTDVVHYTLDIEIDPTAKWIGGSNLMNVNVLVDNVEHFLFRLSDRFNIPVLTVNGNTVTWQRIDPIVLDVTLDRVYNAGESFDLYVAYDGYPGSTGFGSIEFTTHNGTPIAWTLSETWFGYTWWPAKDINTDKATADFLFTVPDTMSVASQGVLVAVDNIGADKLRYHWQTAYPTATYLYSFAVTNYSRFSGVFDYAGWSMPVEYFVYPEDDNSNNRNNLLKTVDMLGVYSDLFGLYPFINEKYGIAQFSWGGGMEHQTVTSQSSFSEWLSSHELGHSWWGDMITCATWHDIWLNEGFATYCEALWVEFKSGQDKQALLNYMSGRRPGSYNGSVYVYDDTDFNRIFSSDFSYRKGGWVLHMLRHVVGDEMFFNILAEYRFRYEYGSAITDDFTAVINDVWGGDDLSWFIDEWVYEPGSPKYRYGWRALTVNGRNYVELYIVQNQSASYPIFQMPTDIVTTASGVDTLNVVWNDAETEHLLFETDDVVSGLAFDPERWILAESYTNVTFVAGPPKILAIEPVYNSKDRVVSIDIVFHKNVQVDVSDFSMTGDNSGDVNLVLNYNGSTQIATLTFAQPLAVDTYTLTIMDTIIDVEAGLALDGELNAYRWLTESQMPSGDGLPGGNAIFRFTSSAKNPGNGGSPNTTTILNKSKYKP